MPIRKGVYVCPCHTTTKLDCIEPNCTDPCHHFEKWNGLAWVHVGYDTTAPFQPRTTTLLHGRP